MYGDRNDAELGKVLSYLDRLHNRLDDPHELARRIGVTLVEDNRVARLAGLGADGRPLRPLAPSTLEDREGDGPPLAPHGEASRVISGFSINIEPIGPSAVLVVGDWPSMPFIRFLNKDRPVVGLRPEAREKLADDAIEFSRDAIKP